MSVNLEKATIFLYIAAFLFYFVFHIGENFPILEFGCHSCMIVLVTQYYFKDSFSPQQPLFENNFFYIFFILAAFTFGVLVGRGRKRIPKQRSRKPSPTPQQTTDSQPKIKFKANVPNCPNKDMSDIDITIDIDENDVNKKFSSVAVFEEAKAAVVAIAEVNSRNNGPYAERVWSTVQSVTHSHLWASHAPMEGIFLRGTATFRCNPSTLLQALKELNLVLGIEGIVHDVEIMEKKDAGDIELTYKRIICRSHSITGSHRDFLAVTGFSSIENGGYVYATRSIPSDFNRKDIVQRKRGFIRGLIHGCGLIIRPKRASALNVQVESDLIISIHVDMSGSSMSSRKQWNSIKSEALLSSLADSLNRLQLVCSTKIDELVSSEKYPIATENPSSGVLSNGESCDDCIQLSSIQKAQLMEVMKSAVLRIRSLHSNFVTSDSLSTPVSSKIDDIGIGNGIDDLRKGSVRGWDTICNNNNGIVVREQIVDSSSPMGILNAFCSIDAPPNIVRKVLQDQIDDIDGLLESHSVLCKVSTKVFVQWMAYRSMWPIGARDFLLITGSEAFYRSSENEGFIIVSQSIDDICEVEFETSANVVNSTSSSSNGNNSVVDGKSQISPSDYTRTLLRLAGYVGASNGRGGTDLHLFVDVDVYSYIPGWLIQMLAQYGLSEMMNRIREASMKLSRPTTRGLLSINGLLHSNNRSSTTNSTSLELNKMLSIIQSREERLMRLRGNSREDATLAAFGISNNGSGGNLVNDVILSSSPKSVSNNPPSMNNLNLNSTPPVSRSKTFSSSSSSTTASTEGVSQSENSDNDALESSVPIAPSPYQSQWTSLAQEALHCLQLYLGTQSSEEFVLDWQVRASKKNCVVYSTPVNGSVWQAIRGWTLIPASKFDILKLLWNDNRIAEYDDMFDTFQFLTSVDPQAAIRRMLFKAIWPTSPRDFVALTTWKLLPDGSIILATRSPPSEAIFASQKGFVRGTIHVSGYWIQPWDSLAANANANANANGNGNGKGGPEEDSSIPVGHCKVTLCAHTELGGSLPASVINMLSSAAPLKVLGTIAEILSK